MQIDVRINAWAAGATLHLRAKSIMSNQTRSNTAVLAKPHTTVRFAVVAAILTALAFISGPLVQQAQAQDDKVYAVSELSTPPKIASTAVATRLILESYPEDLRRKGVGGMVEISFVVNEQGKVVSGSVEIVDATQTALGEAAKKVAALLSFDPGKLNGNKVKTKVTLPIVYKAN